VGLDINSMDIILLEQVIRSRNAFSSLRQCSLRPPKTGLSTNKSLHIKYKKVSQTEASQ